MTLSGLIVLAVFVFRLVFLKISMKNEKAILAMVGANMACKIPSISLFFTFYFTFLALLKLRYVRFGLTRLVL